MAEDSSLMFKIVIIGDSSVGKSNLMTRYATDEFNQDSPSTIGVEFMTKCDKVGGRDVKIQIWDTAGQERFRAISRSIYHGAKGAMLVYDITNQESFDAIPGWLQELRQHVHTTCAIFLIGNKCDLEHLRVIKKEVADRFALENGLSFLETSALDKTNVEKSFTHLVKQIFDVVASGPVDASGRQGGAAKPKGSGAVNLASGKAPTSEEKKKKEGCGC
eukprot:GDKK01041751.1.p1 GENE.GDKK01041751.1~~GDKK01041751.1.p1  ORF type:complete len:249 (-),score=22.96 GDKK01041751.1:250-903(-)